MIAYHATPALRLGRILTEGLRPGMPRTWSDGLGQKQGSRRHLYFSLGEDEAVRWAYKMQYDLGEVCVVVVVDLGETAHEPDPHPEGRLNGYGWVRTTEPVPPPGIDRVLTLTPQRIRAVVARTMEATQAA